MARPLHWSPTLRTSCPLRPERFRPGRGLASVTPAEAAALRSPPVRAIRNDWLVPDHLDFLVALDEYLRNNSRGEVSHGSEMTDLARAARLLDRPGQTAASWTGQLVRLGLVDHGPQSGGAAEIPLGVTWTNRELQTYTHYYVTAEGLKTADRERRRRREISTDTALGLTLPVFDRATAAGLDTSGAAATLRTLQSALDDELPIQAIGHAKELVEAACRWILGERTDRREALPRRYKLALQSTSAGSSDLSNRMVAVVDQLNAMRNQEGAGHGGHSDVPISEARLAASSAIAVTEYLLDAWVASAQRGLKSVSS